MTTTVTNESKNSLTITNETKGQDQTWSAKKGTWTQRGTWAVQRSEVTPEDKNALTITNESKT